MKTDESNAKELTRRLVARAAAESQGPNGVALAAHVAAERASRDLARSLGGTGFNALLTRALAQAEADHPLLKEIRVGRNQGPFLGNVTGIVETYGASAVSAGLETMMTTMLRLLGRLIGDDMVPRLVERVAPSGTNDDEDTR